MRERLSLCVVIAFICSWPAFARLSNDHAVITAFRRADASLTFSRVWHRVDVGDGLDLVVTLGSSRPWDPSPSGRIGGGTTQRIGIFFQRRDAGTVYLISVAPGFAGCDAASIARATRTDLVIWCEGEKSDLQPAQKFVYDIRAKALVARFDFQPFTNYTAKRLANGQLSVRAESTTRRVALTLTPPTGFTVASNQRKSEEGVGVRSRSDVAGQRFGPGKSFRLMAIPDSATDVCDPQIVVATGSRTYRQPWKECGAIGPNQEVGDRLWFGRAFYHGEGWFGTGGFGYFDTSARRFQMFRSAKVAPWSTTAIHVAGESVWLALADHGEYGDTTGGVLFFPSPQSEPRHINIGYCVGRDFVASGESLYLLTDCGVVLITPDAASGYIVDLTSDGRVRVVPGLP